jgi:RsiW-degrading membrane proteinase PrsW (M82 family)
MLDHNTRRVLTSLHMAFLTFDLCFRHVISDISKGANVMMIHAIVLVTIIKRVLLLVVLFALSQVTSDNPKEAIVKVAEGNRLDET